MLGEEVKFLLADVRAWRHVARCGVASHLGKVPFPQTGARKLEDPSCPVAPQIVLHGLRDRSGVRPLAAYTGQLFEKVLVQHKICAFHTHSILPRPWDRRRPRRP